MILEDFLHIIIQWFSPSMLLKNSNIVALGLKHWFLQFNHHLTNSKQARYGFTQKDSVVFFQFKRTKRHQFSKRIILWKSKYLKVVGQPNKHIYCVNLNNVCVVYSFTKLVIASFYRQLSVDIKKKKYKIKTSFVSHEGP